MGFSVNGARFLLLAHARGVSFKRVLMIGRQSLTLTSRDIRTLKRLSISETMRRNLSTLTIGESVYGEQLLHMCGAERVDSMDKTDYEGATVLHDMNLPVPQQWFGLYDAVIDGGSLEHVFNVPTALGNCMEMLKVGGHYLGITPTNNYAGHGFYQFAPELFFAAFAPENGFSMLDAFLYEENGRNVWYRLSQSADLTRRLTFQNRVPAHLLVLARKDRAVELFSAMPQQRMYQVAWDGRASRQFSRSAGVRAVVFRWLRYLPDRMFWFVLNSWNVKNRFRKDMFTRAD